MVLAPRAFFLVIPEVDHVRIEDRAYSRIAPIHSFMR
jgi:hypothetical protein